MIQIIALALFGLAAVATIFRPRIGAVVIWMAIWLYPTGALYGTLPLDIRFDDLWVVFMFVICLALVRSPGAFGSTAFLALLWFLSILIGDLAGFMISGGVAWQYILKDAAKALYVPITVVVLSSVLDDEKSLVGHLRGLSFAAVLCTFLGVAIVYMPNELEGFLAPNVRHGLAAAEMVDVTEELARRAGGSVGTPVMAQICLYVILLGMVVALNRTGKFNRIFFAICGVVCLVGLGYTVSRGCILALGAALLWGIFATRHRGALICIIVVTAIGVLLQGALLERVQMRMAGEGIGSTTFAQGMATRMTVLTDFLEYFNPIYFITGMGMPASQFFGMGTVHNTYVGAMVYGGTFGLVVMVVIIVRAWKTGTRLKWMANDPVSQAIVMHSRMAIIGALVYGWVAENFQNPPAMQLFFATIVFLEKRIQQVQQELPDMVSEEYVSYDRPNDSAVAAT